MQNMKETIRKLSTKLLCLVVLLHPKMLCEDFWGFAMDETRHSSAGGSKVELDSTFSFSG
jgi:hypothetical protein